MDFFKANLWEIKKSGSLRILGALLALFHVTQFYLWWDQGHLPLTFAQEDIPICWSMFESCEWLRAIPIGALTSVYYTYGSFMALAALVFLLTEFAGIGYFFLCFGTIAGLVVYFQDFRLSSNEGFFAFFATVAFLLVPAKHRLMRWLLASLFVASGLSLLSPAWLSGIWFVTHMAVPIKLGEWLAAVTVLVQMIGGVCLIFRDGRYFWAGWLSLFLLCISQLYTGELFLASMGVGWLLYIGFDEFELRKAEREYLYQSFIRPEPSFLWGGILLSSFWLAQVLMFLPYSPQSHLRSFLETWTVTPKVNHQECDQRTFARFKEHTEEIDVKPQLASSPQLSCNPYIFYLDLRGLCRKMKARDPNFATLMSSLLIRDIHTGKSYLAFESKDVCAPNLSFSDITEARWTTNLDM